MGMRNRELEQPPCSLGCSWAQPIPRKQSFKVPVKSVRATTMGTVKVKGQPRALEPTEEA